MSTTPPEAPSPPDSEGPRVTRDELRDVRRLRRTVGADRYVAGVCGGVARHFDIDPAVVRVLFVVLALFGGAGLLLYGALWLLLPADGEAQAMINLDPRSLTVALVGVVAFAAILLVGDSWGGFGFPWPLTVIGIVVAVVLLSRDRRQTAPPHTGYPYDYPPTGPYAADAPAGAPVRYHVYPPSPGPGWVGPGGIGAPVAWTPPPRPVNPRKRGPILFWFTLALVALAVGTLGLIDVSGATVVDSAYPALALGITGAMLLVGAFFGRAGGLILVGLMLAAGLSVTSVVENYDSEQVRYSPDSAAEVQDSYRVDAGELILDLRGVDDLESLDGRTVVLDADLGRIEVLLPDGVDVDIDAAVSGAGDVSVLGRHSDGFDPSIVDRQDVRDEDAAFDLDITLDIGEIVVSGNR
jgi:phage shock protein PspC (stress-responsive transcriptional regulator)